MKDEFTATRGGTIWSNQDSGKCAALSRALSLGAVSMLLFLSVEPAAEAAAAQPVKKPARPVLAVPWQVSVQTPPTLFSSNGRHHLAYEIEIGNLSPDIWTLEKIIDGE